MKRLNITLPDELNFELKKIPNKSRFIAEALREKLKKLRSAQLDKLLIEGYKATRNEDKKINAEWEAVTLENWPEYE